MKNIPYDIANAFRIFTFSEQFKEYNSYLLCDFLLGQYKNGYIIIHDGRNVCVKFGYGTDENTFTSYKKLISKDKIFKLTKKDLE